MAQEYKTMDATKKKDLLNKLKHNSTKLWMNRVHLPVGHAYGQLLYQIIQYLMSKKIINRAPRESKHPLSLMTHELCEELASISSIAPNGQIWLYCRMTYHISCGTDQLFSSDFKFRFTSPQIDKKLMVT